MQSYKQMFRLQVYYLNNAESQCICSVLMFHHEESVKCSTEALHSDLSFQIFTSGRTSKHSVLRASKTLTLLHMHNFRDIEIFTEVELPKSLQELLHTCE